jgi:predicted N-acetyltransferase YhbS
MRIDSLFNHPQHLHATAQMIYDEFWVGVAGGRTVEGLVAHLQTATDPRRIPLSLIAIDDQDGSLIGTVNLIDNDDDQRAHLHPWLAALVVRADRRSTGVGSALVLALLQSARAMAIPRLYLGTDGPGFYLRLGALLHEQVKPDFCILRFELAGGGKR